MSFIRYNRNPIDRRTIDCTIRAISTIENKSWERVYWGVCAMGSKMYSMPSANDVWGKYLDVMGYHRGILPNTCPACYTVRDFCRDFPTGEYIVGTGSHVIAVIDGDWYDTWDSRDEVLLFYWWKGRN